MNYRTNLAALLAFVVLAAVGGWALHSAGVRSASDLYKDNLVTCVRANDLRRESNARIPAHEAEARVVHDFLRAAEVARVADYQRSHEPAAKRAANQYENLIERLDRSVHFDRVPIIDCVKVIHKP